MPSTVCWVLTGYPQTSKHFASYLSILHQLTCASYLSISGFGTHEGSRSHPHSQEGMECTAGILKVGGGLNLPSGKSRGEPRSQMERVRK